MNIAPSASRGLAVAVAGWLMLLPAPDASAGAPASRHAIHVVKPGESLSIIARHYRVSVPALVTANRLSGGARLLRAGQRLVIPAFAPAAAVRRPPPLPQNVALGVPKSEGTPRLEWPVEGIVTSQFGRRRGGWHRGIDIQAEMGTPVRAAAAGTVVASGYEDRYGLVVKIEHSPDLITVYAHTLQNFVEVGEEVHAGQVIAQVGRSGHASNYHLHFELRHAGIAYNPMLVLPWPPPPATPVFAGATGDVTTTAGDEGDQDDGR